MDKATIISEGIAAGQVFIFTPDEEKDSRQRKFQTVKEEKARLEEAVNLCREEIKNLLEETAKKLSQKEADIFNAHLLFLEDPMLIDDVKRLIETDEVTAEEALRMRLSDLQGIFSEIPDEMFRNRWADLRDVGHRLQKILSKENIQPDLFRNEKIILLIPEISPSEILNRVNQVCGIIVLEGAHNSHSAILARALKIPVLVQKNAFDMLKSGQEIILDCLEGKIITSPDEKDTKNYKNKLSRICPVDFRKPSPVETFTSDGIKTTLMANIVNNDEAFEVIRAGAEGVGIYRTEFAYFSHMPSEEELFLNYRTILERLNPLPVTFRTLDLGADKWPHYLPPPEKTNPSLGLRGIRYSLRNPEIFKTQLRAIMRASSSGNARIILPMVSCIEDIRKTKERIRKIRQELNREIPLGIMLETPSSILSCDILSQEVDFMSIGTNDLVQYTMAADRENEDMKEWYQPVHPSLLKLYKMAAEAGERYNIPVSICGEIGGDTSLIPLLMGCGIRQFSLNPSGIEKVREKIKSLRYENLRALAEKAMLMQI